MTLLDLVAVTAGLWGALLLGSSIPRRRSLTDRLRLHSPGSGSHTTRHTALSPLVVLRPVALWFGDGLARIFGAREDLGVRLERVHHPDDIDRFRLRQGSWAMVGLGAAAAVATVARPAPPLALVCLLAAPVLGFVVPEQLLADRIAARRRRTTLEVPLVAEQLAMLLGAGLSLGAALSRIGDRSDGAIGEDLRRVMRRVRHGIRERDALDEWAVTAGVPAVTRLVAVLRLHGEASDLGRLVTEEARAARDEAHRSLLATVERKDQQVWVPVTVAALLPGCVFLAIPFVEALRPFTG